MKAIALIALAVALGLAWTGVAIPADEVKEKARETKQDVKDTAREAKDETKDKASDTKETVTEKAKSAVEKTKEKVTELKEKAKAKLGGKDKTAATAPATNVRSAQDALKNKGYDPGPIDGVMGPKTRAALRDFQKKEGLKDNGRLDVATSERLGVPSVSNGTAASPSTEPRPAPEQK